MAKPEHSEAEVAKRRTRLVMIVVAHVLIVLTFFASSFLWGNFS